MNAPFKQDERIGAFNCALGPDRLVLLRMQADEHVNNLFAVHVDALSAASDIDLETLLGTNATVSLKSFDNPPVHFDGVITEARFAGTYEGGWRYELVLRPWLWLASRRRKQQIYHEKSVIEILQEMLQPYLAIDAAGLDLKLSADYPKLEYTVQYRESDLDFCLRQMERFGISYHFVHLPGQHKLVLTDDVIAHDPLPGGTRVWVSVADKHRADKEHFWDVQPTRRITTGAVRLTDYNFKTPLSQMEVDRKGDAGFAQGDWESYDYPGDYLEAKQGQNVARLRTQQERGQDARHDATGDCTSLRAGLTVKINAVDKITGVDEPVLCLRAQHIYSSNAYVSGPSGSDGPTYEGRYTLMPTSSPLAPERKTTIPCVQGPQTAVVVGEGEIDCDEYGRILVHFHWDLEKRFSMRCRVSQNWASKGWGGMVIPRIGMEVIVEFLEGDPDKPIVTGCVYNGKNNPSYPLPAHKTRSIFRTDTHKGTGFNEVRFEDEKSLEEIQIHAQRDMNSVIRRDDYRSVGRHDGLEVRRDHTVSVGGNSINETKGTIEIASGRGTVISSGAIGMSSRMFSNIVRREEPEFMNAKTSLLAMESAMATGGITVRAQTMLNEQVGMSRIAVIGATSTEFVGAEKAVQVGKLMSLRSGGTFVVETADNLAVTAGDRVDIVCGKSSIRMTSDGKIEIKGTSIKLDAGQIDMN